MSKEILKIVPTNFLDLSVKGFNFYLLIQINLKHLDTVYMNEMNFRKTDFKLSCNASKLIIYRCSFY